MLVEFGIADAYGAAFEFVKQPFPKGLDNDGHTFQWHPELPIGNGMYTDDTQMALAIAEEMLADGPFTKESLADRFVDVFKRDPRPGYGKKFYALLQEVSTGAELLAKIDNTSTRSGGCMRVGPIGLYPDLAEVLHKAKVQAQVTHDTKEAIMAAQAIAASTHYLAYTVGPLRQLGDWLEQTVPGHAWSMEWPEWASVQALPVAHAAITVLRRGNSQLEVMQIAVEQGGDVDTTSALSVWMASFCKSKPNNLPMTLYDGLEKGAYGMDYLNSIDQLLDARFKLWQL